MKDTNNIEILEAIGLYCPTTKMTKQEAIGAGLEFYFTGVPCKRGHIDIRKVSNRHCQQCQFESYHKHKEKYLKIQEKRRAEKPKEIKKYNTSYYHNQKNEPMYKASRLSEKRRNGAARNAKREARKIAAVPSWYNKAEVLKKYKESTNLTSELNIRHNVHHIIPLQSCRSVCGLHCADNLIVITEEYHKILHSDINELMKLW